MHLSFTSLTAALLVPCLCLAQASGAPPSPPLVSAPEAAPAPQPDALQPATPPPPGAIPPPTGVPAAPGTAYPYSPYGSPLVAQTEPPKEIGLMVTEGALGILTAGAATLLPYFLLLRPLSLSTAGAQGAIGSSESSTIVTLLTVVLFAAVPLSVSQTEVGIANGSRYYFAESWPATLSGLGAEAAILAIYFLTPRTRSASGRIEGSELMLLVSTVAVVPLVELAVINLTKTPKHKLYSGQAGSLMGYSPEHGLSAGVPTPAPLFRLEREPRLEGLQVSLLTGRF